MQERTREIARSAAVGSGAFCAEAIVRRGPLPTTWRGNGNPPSQQAPDLPCQYSCHCALAPAFRLHSTRCDRCHHQCPVSRSREAKEKKSWKDGLYPQTPDDSQPGIVRKATSPLILVDRCELPQGFPSSEHTTHCPPSPASDRLETQLSVTC